MTEGKGNPQKINDFLKEAPDILEELKHELYRVRKSYQTLSNLSLQLNETSKNNKPINPLTIGKYINNIDTHLSQLSINTITEQEKIVDSIEETIKELDTYFKTQYLETMRENGETLDWF